MGGKKLLRNERSNQEGFTLMFTGGHFNCQSIKDASFGL